MDIPVERRSDQSESKAQEVPRQSFAATVNRSNRTWTSRPAKKAHENVSRMHSARSQCLAMAISGDDAVPGFATLLLLSAVLPTD
jgi:hypothetical protein